MIPGNAQVHRRERLPTFLLLMALVVTLASLGACSKHNPVSPGTGGGPGGGVQVVGVVRDSAARPLGGALVTLTDAAGLSRLARATASRTTTTDSTTGRFTFTDVQPGDYRLTVEAFRYVAASDTVHVGSGSSDSLLAFALEAAPSGTFTGTVTLERAPDPRNSLVTLQSSPLVVATDPDGRYTLPVVPLGTWNITASHPGYRDTTITGTLVQAGDAVTLPSLVLKRNMNQLPSAGIGVDGFCAGLVTTLTALNARDPDGTIAQYAWDYENDGSIDSVGARLTRTSYVYGAGSHVARLVVTDDEGGAASQTVQFTIVGADTLFVSGPTGSLTGNGTREAPFLNLRQAFNQPGGPCPSRVIMVAVGYYQEPLNMDYARSHWDLVGGLDPRTWQRAPHAYSTVGSPYSYFSAVTNTRISGFEFRALVATPADGTSIAVSVTDSPSSLVFDDCRFIAGQGGPGSNGVAGAGGQAGQAGAEGGPAFTSGANTGGGSGGGGGGGRGAHGGAGGAGATAGTTINGSDGTAGESSDGVTSPGAAGGSGTNECYVVAGSGNNAHEAPGGSPGAQGSGPFPSDSYVGRGHDGGVGGPGPGGGGGGGGGAAGRPLTCPVGSGGGGGGGGGGGTGGQGGRGGDAGGSSIALQIGNSSARFIGCTFATDSAGAGGAGGNGGIGGQGGPGGHGGSPSGGNNTAGGEGGFGGRGGQGGPGGGASVCVWRVGGNPTFDACTFLPGVPGAGGPGGFRGGTYDQAPAGPTGLSGAFGP